LALHGYIEICREDKPLEGKTGGMIAEVFFSAGIKQHRILLTFPSFLFWETKKPFTFGYNFQTICLVK
jgi:hypothetical protein